MFGLVSERASHPTTARVERVDVVARATEHADRVVVLLDCLLVTVAVVGERRFGGRPVDALVEPEAIEILTDAVRAGGDGLDRLAREQIERVRLEHHGVGGFREDDVPAVSDLRGEFGDVPPDGTPGLVDEALRECRAAAVGPFGHVDVDACSFEDANRRLPHFGVAVVGVRVREEDGAPLGLGGRNLRAAARVEPVL